MFADAAIDDFFRARLDHMIDLRHSLAVLASRMPWQHDRWRISSLAAHTPVRRCPIWTCSVRRQRCWRASPTPGARGWLLRMIAKKGVAFLWRLYLRLCRAAALPPNWSRMLRKLAVHAFGRPAPRLAAL